jgi:hypothetical protein
MGNELLKDKLVKWDKCSYCGTTEPPKYICTDVHVVWGTKTNADGTLSRNITVKELGESPKASYLICSKCDSTIADNVTTNSDLCIIRHVEDGRINIGKKPTRKKSSG